MKKRTSAESRYDRQDLEDDLINYIQTGGHWRHLIPALGLKQFGEDGYLNNTYSGAHERARKLAVDANQEKTVQGIKLTAELVRGRILDVAIEEENGDSRRRHRCGRSCHLSLF